MITRVSAPASQVNSIFVDLVIEVAARFFAGAVSKPPPPKVSWLPGGSPPEVPVLPDPEPLPPLEMLGSVVLVLSEEVVV